MCGVCVMIVVVGGDAGVVRGYGDMEMEMDMGLCGGRSGATIRERDYARAGTR